MENELSTLKGVGPTTLEKLETAGISTLMALATSSPAEVSSVAGLSENAARKLIKQAREGLSLGFEKAKEFAKKRDIVEKISVGCAPFDEMLGGGFESGAITEVYGQFGCLSGDTIIRTSRHEKGHKHRIDWIYKQFHERESLNEHFRWDLETPTYIRSYNGTNIGRHPIEDVVYSGEKQVYELVLDNEYKLKATPEHKIMTDSGWIEVQNLTSEHSVMCDTPNTRKNTQGHKTNTLRDFYLYDAKHHPKCKKSGHKGISIHRAIYEACINNITISEYVKIVYSEPDKAQKLKYVDTNTYAIHHKDGNHYNNDIENLELVTHEEHVKIHGSELYSNFNQGVPEFVKVKSVTKLGIEKTYDIVCAEPFHNFNANEMIVHNSGKTQLSHLLVVRALIENPNNKAIFLDTENTFRDDRIIDFAEANGLDPDEALDRIFVARAYNSDHQQLLVDEIEKMLQQDQTFRVIVVDSLTSHFRAEFIGRGTLASRQQHLNKHMHQLLRLADLYNMVVLCSNQVMSAPDSFYGDPTKPIGGHIVGHNSTFRIYMRPGKEGSIYAKLVDSPNLPQTDCNFWVTKDGFADVKPK